MFTETPPASPGGPARGAYGRGLAATVLGLLVAVVAVAWSGTPIKAGARRDAVHVAPSPSALGTDVKFYIVGDPGNGQREFLFKIAAKTLGNGNRYREIFALNAGRFQPDGQRMVDPAVINPGWILLLPSDATGPGVRQGPMPQFTPPFSLRTAPAGRANRSQPGQNGTVENVVRVAAVTATILLLGVAIRLLRRGTMIVVPRGGSIANVGAGPGPRRRVLPSPPPVPGPGPSDPALPRRRTPRPPEALGSLAPPAAAPGAVASRPPHALASDHPRIPGDAVPDLSNSIWDHRRQVLNVEVTDGEDVIAVRLAGARTHGTRSYVWVGAGKPRPHGAGIVALGSREGRILLVDLSQSPDVVTITGPAARRPRLVHSMARQLQQSGAAVSIVGDAAGAVTPPGARTVSAFDELAISRPQESLEVIFGTIAGFPDLPMMRRLISPSNRRAVIVILSEAQRARWSIDLRTE